VPTSERSRVEVRACSLNMTPIPGLVATSMHPLLNGEALVEQGFEPIRILDPGLAWVGCGTSASAERACVIMISCTKSFDPSTMTLNSCTPNEAFQPASNLEAPRCVMLAALAVFNADRCSSRCTSSAKWRVCKCPRPIGFCWPFRGPFEGPFMGVSEHIPI
jgi:hypothetical protein